MSARKWTRDEIATLRQFYPHEPTATTAARLGRSVTALYAAAKVHGLNKTPKYLASPAAGRMLPGDTRGTAGRYPPGHVPANKGLRRPGWAPGRMRDSQFKKGGFPVNKDPDYYVLGALRVNADGYIDMRISFEPGAKGWRGLHLILWEDAHGPIPPGHCVVFKNRDKLDVELDNLELITRANNMRRNTIHNLPAPLKSAIQVLGQLKRRVNERSGKQQPRQDSRGPSDTPVRDAAGPA